MHELPDRPAPPVPPVERVRRWVQWIGAGRLATGAVVVVAVVAGAYWLVRPPEATTESSIPYAQRSTTVPAVPTTEAAPATATTDPGPASIVVHVAGAVNRPGVYELPAGARVVDAIAAAGGTAPLADVDAVNLAAPVHDGERVYVPEVGESVPAVVAGSTPPVEGSGTPPGPIDINTASEDELDALPGVGPATAAAIVAYRDQHGPFGTVDDLAEVRGIGPAKLAAIRDLVTV